MKRGLLPFIGLVISALAPLWLFVFEQKSLIINPAVFWTLTGTLLVLSFWTSATEAAYAVVNKVGEPPTLTKKIQNEAQRLSDIASKQEFIKDPKLLDNRVLKRLVARSDTLSAGSRDDFVGAFACASVFLNTALVAFFPIALASQPQMTGLTQLIAKHNQLSWLAQFAGSKSLTFVATTLLILIFGKIFPKMIGFAFPYVFTYRLGRLADVVHFLFGWIPRGIKFPLGNSLEGHQTFAG